MKLAASTASSEELAALLVELEERRWRGQQLADAIWNPSIASLDQVRQFSTELRQELAGVLDFSTVLPEVESEADKGNTIKILCRLADGETVEAVAMETPPRGNSRRRSTVCVSSQVGCAVGCPFCATGQMGLRRNCTAAEIVDQVRISGQALARRGLGPVTHVVFMGMGEPLSNYDNVVSSLRALHDGAGISARRITVSTSGVVPGIERLASEKFATTLAISLHASDDKLRDKLVPLNKRFPLERLMLAAEGFIAATHRRLTLEWCLIGGINDSDEQAIGLRNIAFRLRAHVNVIPMNHVDGSPWGPPSEERTEGFMTQLDGVRHTIRDTRGGQTDAACGQLRANLEQRRWVTPEGVLSAPRPVRKA